MSAGGPLPKDHQFSVKFTAEQAKLIEQRAKACGLRTGAWMRSILLQAAARKPVEGGFLRIREPNGDTQ